MAVETGAIFKRLYFDGQSSGTYGVYITGEAVFSAPQRDVEMIKIPGRNGEFALDNGRFQNIEVTYPAGIFADSETDFAAAISDFRNFLASRVGYCRLEDEYNPNEYRMAVYKSGLDVDAKVLKAGEFSITFDCKPQRWLKDGETAVAIGEWGETETASGDIVTVENPNGILAVKSLEIDLEPMQSGSGTPSPTNIRPISGHTSVDVIVSPTTSASDGTTYTTALGRTVYGGTLDVTSGVLTVDRRAFTIADIISAMANVTGYQSAYTASNGIMSIRCSNTSVVSSLGIEKSSAGALISSHFVRGAGWNNINSEGKFGYIDGIIITAHYSAFGLSEWDGGTSSLTEAQKTTIANAIRNCTFAWKLAEPQTYQLTPQQISLLTGDNNIWSDGAITLEYGQNPSVLFNPTLFESSPFLEAEGEGIINFNGYEIDLDGVPYGEVTIGEHSYDWHTSPVTVTLDTTLLNIGDTIYPQVKDCDIMARIQKTSGADLYLNSVSSATNILEVKSNSHTGKRGDEFHIYLYPDFGDGFVYGTSKTITCTAVIIYRVGVNPASTPTYTETIEITITYDGADTYTIAASGTGTLPPNNTRLNCKIGVPTMYGNSTKAVSDVPIYIDCDLGEAYIIIDGAYVSLNHRIDLGSELPKLASGSNTVVFDDTITDFKVTPRWWKI